MRASTTSPRGLKHHLGSCRSRRRENTRKFRRPQQLHIHTLSPFFIQDSSRRFPRYSPWMSSNENLDQSIVHATLIRPRSYPHRNEAVHPCRLKVPRSTSVGRTVKQAKNVLGFSTRGEVMGEQSRLGGVCALLVLRRSAGFHRWFRLGGPGECGWVKERARTWENSWICRVICNNSR